MKTTTTQICLIFLASSALCPVRGDAVEDAVAEGKKFLIEQRKTDAVGAFQGYMLNRHPLCMPAQENSFYQGGRKDSSNEAFTEAMEETQALMKKVFEKIYPAYERAGKEIVLKHSHISAFSADNFAQRATGKLGSLTFSIEFVIVNGSPIYFATLTASGDVLMPDTRQMNSVTVYQRRTPIASLDQIEEAFVFLAKEFHESYTEARAVRGR